MIINIFRMCMAQACSLIINACTLPLVNAMGGSTKQRSWIIVSIMYGVCLLYTSKETDTLS